MLGWPYETGVTLARLIFSGIMDRFPDLKVIAHHLGGVVPYLEGRVGHSFDQLGVRTSDEDYGAILKSLKKRPFDYFKDYYGDTAMEGARAATVCGIDFFTADHVLFASDCPFDKEKGPGLHPRHVESSQLARSVECRAGEDLLSQRGEIVRACVSIAASRRRGRGGNPGSAAFVPFIRRPKLRPPPYRSVRKAGAFGLRIPHINHAPKQDFDQRGF